MLRTRSPLRSLSWEDQDEALALCARDPVRNVFVSARILDGALRPGSSAVIGHRIDGELVSLCWSSANVMPVATNEHDQPFYAERLRRWRPRCASILGPRDEVSALWSHLEPSWGAPRAIRSRQPLLVATRRPTDLGIRIDSRVRPAQLSEVDLVLPAAVHMFTREIGYPPYTGNSRSYKSSLRQLIGRGHTFVIIDGGEVIFKTDVGSSAHGCAQLQGVWLTPRLRGQRLATSMLAGVMEYLMETVPTLSLYVNDYNSPARAVYDRLGFTQVGEFSTILM